LVSPITGDRWRVECDPGALPSDTVCPKIRAQAAAVWFDPGANACTYPGAAELLVHRDGLLFERLRYVDSLGTVMHYWPCMRVGISVATSGVPSPTRLSYRVLRFGKEVELLHEFPAGQLSIETAGATEVVDPQQLLVESSDSTAIWVSTSGRNEILSLRSNGCAAAGAVPIAAIFQIHLPTGDQAPREPSAPAGTRRKLAFFHDEGVMKVGMLLDGKMEIWNCLPNSPCTLQSVFVTSELTVSSFLCDGMVCSMAASKNDSLLVLRHRID
jgi:hypothetical protein